MAKIFGLDVQDHNMFNELGRISGSVLFDEV